MVVVAAVVVIIGIAVTTLVSAPGDMSNVAIIPLSLSGLSVSTIIGAAVAITAILNPLNENFQFQIRSTTSRDRITVTAGLLQTRKQSIPLNRVHGFLITQPLLWRPFGWARAEISVAGYGTEIGGNETLVPVAPLAQIQALVAELDAAMTQLPDAAATGDGEVHTYKENAAAEAELGAGALQLAPGGCPPLIGETRVLLPLAGGCGSPGVALGVRKLWCPGRGCKAIPCR